MYALEDKLPKETAKMLVHKLRNFGIVASMAFPIIDNKPRTDHVYVAFECEESQLDEVKILIEEFIRSS